MTLVSARGIVVSERMQNVLIAIQFGVLIIASIWALARVFSGTAGAQAITPQLSWLWPSNLDLSSITAAGPIGGVFVLGVGMLVLGIPRCWRASPSAPSGSSAARRSMPRPKSRSQTPSDPFKEIRARA